MSAETEFVPASRKTASALAVFAERRTLVMLALGFSAALPYFLIFDTLSAWRRASGHSLEVIGFFSLVTLVSTFKFLWAPFIDRAQVPVLNGWLGHRRSWMLVCQGVIMLGLWLLAGTDPSRSLGTIAVFAVLVGFSSATQDIAIDAWRIEAADISRQGAMAAAYQWGYRLGIIVAGAVPLLLAETYGWNFSYAVMAALMTVGMLAVLAAPREERHVIRPIHAEGIQIAPAREALELIPRLSGQQPRRPSIPARALNHMTLTVSDVKRSVDFYQGLFGMPIQARQSATVLLRIGAGPQFIAIGRRDGNVKPGIGHFCMTTEHFNAHGVMSILAQHGVMKVDAPGGGLSGGPMKARVHMRLADRGGATEGTSELYLGDPDGIVIQLQDTTYCGGGGVLGDRCPAPEPAPTRGVLAVRDLNHFTMSVTDGQRGAAFYQELFGLRIHAHQGANPVLGVGTGVQFVMANGPAPGRARAAGINHACMTVSGFDPDRVLKALTDFGLKPRGNGPAGPLVHYMSMRMPDRGGASGGTPELYFTDPDGLVMQLQDTSYCGGGGLLGSVCAGA